MWLSKRAKGLKPSPTMAITAKAKSMKAEGIDVVGFGAGEPDFDTPKHIKEAAKRALDEGFTKYTPAAGILELRRAVAKKLEEENGINYSENQIVITDGAKFALFSLFLSILDESDEVIIPAPYWVTYPEQVKFAGGKPVFVNTKEEDDFKLKASEIEQAITDKTKAIVLCSPNNPTGAVIDKEELEKIAALCVERKILIVSDECYERIIYDGKKHISPASLSEEVKEVTVTINALSKSYSMTGWRVGYAAGPEEIISAMVKVNSQSTSNVNSIAQKAAVAALTGDKSFFKDWLRAFDQRRRYIVSRLNKIKGFSCKMPSGSFYVFPNVKEAMNKLGMKSDFDFAEYLLEKALVATVPGSAFGMNGYLRLSYATDMDNIKKGLDRIERLMEEVYG